MNRKHFGCLAPNCTNPHQAKGYCNLHDQRLRRTGTLEAKPYGNPDYCTYEAAHARNLYARGRASNYTCECGNPAKQWAYQGNSEKELTTVRECLGGVVREVRYSPDPNDYAPMCVPCHVKLDKFGKRPL